MQEFYCTFAEIAHDRETTPSRQKMKKVHALLAGVFRKVKKNRRRNKHLCQANRSTRTDRADQSGVGVKRKKLVVLEILASQIGPFFFSLQQAYVDQRATQQHRTAQCMERYHAATVWFSIRVRARGAGRGKGKATTRASLPARACARGVSVTSKLAILPVRAALARSTVASSPGRPFDPSIRGWGARDREVSHSHFKG